MRYRKATFCTFLAAILVGCYAIAPQQVSAGAGALASAIRQAFGAPVDVGVPADNEILTYDAATGTWGAEAPAAQAAEDLAATLVAGNTTGGTSISVSAGDDIVGSTTSDVSFPGAGAGSERFGLGATATGSNTVAVGNSASTDSAVRATAVGGQSTANANDASAFGNAAQATGPRSLSLGQGTVASGSQATAVGEQCTAAGANSTTLGRGANTGSGHAGGLALGHSAATTAANQMVAGNESVPITEMVIGEGSTSTTPGTVTWRATDAEAASGADGGDLLIRPGNSDGAGENGTLSFTSGGTSYPMTASSTGPALTTTAQTIIEAINEIDAASPTETLAATLAAGNATGGTAIVGGAGTLDLEVTLTTTAQEISAAINEVDAATVHDGAGADSTAVGTGATAPNSGATSLGDGATAGTDATALGRLAGAARPDSLAVGHSAGIQGPSGTGGIAIGHDALIQSGHNYSIAIGVDAQSEAAGQFVVGSSVASITQMSIGEGVNSSSPAATVTIQATDASAASGVNGSGLTISAGDGDGVGNGGDLTLNPGSPGASGASGNIDFQTGGTSVATIDTSRSIHIAEAVSDAATAADNAALHTVDDGGGTRLQATFPDGLVRVIDGGRETRNPASWEVILSAAQNIGDSSLTEVAWDTEVEDPGAIHSAGTVTIAIPGRYYISTSGRWESNATGFRQVTLALNGTTIEDRNWDAGGSAATTQGAETTIRCDVGDTLTVEVQQSSTGTIEFGNLSDGSARRWANFTGYRIGP